MTVYVSPFGPKPQFMLSTGLPAVGGLLFAYVAGSVGTKQNTYTTSAGSVANTNPIVLNSLGEPATQIWLTGGQTYKFVLAPSTDTDPPTSPVWSIDNLSGINDVSVASAASEWAASNLTPTYVGATQFTMAGDQTSTLTVGRRVKCSVTAGTSYGTITASAYAALTTITVNTAGSNPLDSGLTAVSFGILSSVNPSVPGWFLVKQPTRQVFTSGTAATYTTPTGTIRINVRMVGGGAGGGGGSANNGTAGNNSTFSTLTAAGGGAGAANGGLGGIGGAASGGDINIPGGGGGGGFVSGAGAYNFPGGTGGNSAFGGGGLSTIGAGGNGGNAATNSGGGGAGGGSVATVNTGGGGGAGGYVEKLILTPATTYTYTVGAAANGGAAGTAAGGNGAAGLIIVDEYYN